MCSYNNNYDRNAQLFNMFNNPNNVLGANFAGNPTGPFAGVLSVPQQVQTVQTVVQDYAFTAVPIQRPRHCEEKKEKKSCCCCCCTERHC